MKHNDNEFQGFFAEFYDILHRNCNDDSIYPMLLMPYGTKILELGSGTGRVAIPLAKAGFDVTGIEAETDMIALMEKKDYPKNRLHVVRCDARNFSLNEKFNVILLSCNFVSHFSDAADVVSILSSCRKHLAPGGCILIDCSAPDTEYMAGTNGREELFSYATERGSEIRDYFRPVYHFLSQTETDTIRLEEWKDGILLREACTEMCLTWYYPREIRSLIREAGLRILRESSVLAPEDSCLPIGPDSCSMFFFCG